MASHNPYVHLARVAFSWPHCEHTLNYDETKADVSLESWIRLNIIPGPKYFGNKIWSPEELLNQLEQCLKARDLRFPGIQYLNGPANIWREMQRIKELGLIQIFELGCPLNIYPVDQVYRAVALTIGRACRVTNRTVPRGLNESNIFSYLRILHELLRQHQIFGEAQFHSQQASQNVYLLDQHCQWSNLELWQQSNLNQEARCVRRPQGDWRHASAQSWQVY